MNTDTATLTTIDRFFSTRIYIGINEQKPDAYISAMWMPREGNAFEKDVVFIHELYTTPACRGQGFATGLVHELLRWSQTHYPDLRTVVRVVNNYGMDTARMVTFWYKRGFTNLQLSYPYPATFLYI